MKTQIAALARTLGSALGLLAYGGMEHITGFVKSVSAESVVAETLKHETVTVRLTDQTEAMKSGVKASLKDLKTGDRVDIHAVKDPSGAFEAHEVAWGPTSNSKK